MTDLSASTVDILQLADDVREGNATASELARAHFATIAQKEPKLNSFVTVTSQLATRQAAEIDQRAERGDALGALAGVPIAVKDIYDVNGLPTTAGMGMHLNAIADRNATVIDRLFDAGTVLLGKTVLTEGVYAEHTQPFTAPTNPWHSDYWSGASSSGSGVAVAAGLTRAALASETGGSIKLPSAANGVTAIKPSWGRVSRHGVFELAATLDHVGPIARSVRDAAAILQVIAGPDPLDPTAAKIAVPDYLAAAEAGAATLRVGLDAQWIARDVDDETRGALEQAVAVLANAGADIRDVQVPDVSDMIWDWFPVCAVQTALAHAETFPSQRADYGPALTQLLDMGNALSGLDYQRLLLKRNDFSGRMDALFDDIDLLAIPVLGFPVPTIERMANIDDELIAGLHRFTCPFNMSGHPGIVLPCGMNRDGLPIVFQLVGQRFAEATLIAAGGAYQAATQWHLTMPSV